MNRIDIFKARLYALWLCVWMLLDCALAVLLQFAGLFWAVATKQEGEPPTPFETLSARAGRAKLNRKWWGFVTAPLIDLLFIRQSPRAELPDGRVFEHPSHCLRAWAKTRAGAYLPASYHRPLPRELEACYRQPTTP